MLESLRRLVHLSRFDDEEKTRVAELLNLILLFLLVATVLLGVFFRTVRPQPVSPLFDAAMVGLYCILLILLRRGVVYAASIMLVIALWFTFTAGTFFYGGIDGAVYGGHVIVIVIAGLLLGGRAALLTAVASIAAGMLMVFAEQAGILPSPLAAPTLSFFLIGKMSHFLTVALLLYLAVNNLRNALERSRRAEQALRESEERYALAMRVANDGIWDWDLSTEEIYFSPRWKTALGYEEDEITNDPDEWFSRVHPDDIGVLRANLDAHLEGVTPHFEAEYRIRQKDGRYCWMLANGVAVRDANGTPYRIAGCQFDITERKDTEERLRHEAMHDSLTGLPNRSLFMEQLSHAMAAASRYSESYAVLFMDLDHFKRVNDTFGHAVGDEILIQVGRRLKRGLRASDTVARFGGDEFAVLAQDIEDQSDAVMFAERIERHVREPFAIKGHELHMSASIGIVIGKTRYTQPAEVLRDADAAMYKAKARGKARYEIYEE